MTLIGAISKKHRNWAEFLMVSEPQEEFGQIVVGAVGH